MIYPRSQAVSVLNELYHSKTPFFCFTDFLAERAWIRKVDDISSSELDFHFPGQTEKHVPEGHPSNYEFRKSPISYDTYEKTFNQVVHQIKIGNSYLTNLTFKTPIHSSLTLSEIFECSQAPYRMRYGDEFVVFSPETFVRIDGEKIYSYPMKGTIDASISDAEAIILADHKEMAEHITIVDLIRNDISQIASKVEVTKFRFVSELRTSDKTLLQVSSEISGILDQPQALGENLFSLLPAGSISGAPKKQTLEIISNAEKEKRNFFTGICGYFDGKIFDSAVMIRFIEKQGNHLYFRSGGGITAFSDPIKEYQEMIDKVYVQIY